MSPSSCCESPADTLPLCLLGWRSAFIYTKPSNLTNKLSLFWPTILNSQLYNMCRTRQDVKTIARKIRKRVVTLRTWSFALDVFSWRDRLRTERLWCRLVERPSWRPAPPSFPSLRPEVSEWPLRESQELEIKKLWGKVFIIHYLLSTCTHYLSIDERTWGGCNWPCDSSEACEADCNTHNPTCLCCREQT